MADSSNNLMAIVKLRSSGAGYRVWRMNVQDRLTYEDLWDLNNDLPTDVKTKSAKARAAICMACHDDLKELLPDDCTVVELWSAIDNLMRPKNLTSLAELTKALCNLKLEGNESAIDYIGRAKAKWGELKAVGGSMEETEFVLHMLHGLPDCFDPMVTTLTTLGDYTLAVDVVQPKIIEFERRVKQEVHAKEEVKALVAHRYKSFKLTGNKAGGNKAGAGCWLCTLPGHKHIDCPLRQAAEAAVAKDKAMMAFGIAL